MPAPIEDYAFLSDMQSAALVAKDGSIDWLTFPRFDSGACFAALLGDDGNGRWQVTPAAAVRNVRRHYRGDSLVLETVFECDGGEVAVVDCMPVREDHLDLVRLVEGRRGSVAMRTELIVRFDYGSLVPWTRRVDGALVAIGGPDALRLLTPVELAVHGDGPAQRATAEFTVGAGERVPFVLTWHPSHEPCHDPVDGAETVAGTERWWTEWVARCRYDGEWAGAVRRSLVVVKALTYAPTGGICAAPTTSLPEYLGGERNWDYRYCWLRDATYSLLALLEAGFTDEARAWRDWLLRTVGGDPSTLHIMYGLGGEARLPELQLGWLSGYEGSQPVRTGNGACTQFQLDVYGEVVDMLYQAGRAGISADEDAWQMQQRLVAFLEDAWHRPDEGIWEVRGDRQQFTHSKVMAWVAFDRMVRAVTELGYEGPVERWRACRDAIRDEVLTRGVDDRGVLVQCLDGDELDASLLMVPLVGFLPADDDRVVNTVAAVQRELVHDGFVRRYRTETDVDGLPPGEGTFLLCSFWLADVLAMQGRHDQARALFERLLGLTNDVGLLAEEYDPSTGRLLGNFPQAFSHTALVTTAMSLSRSGGPARRRSAPG